MEINHGNGLSTLYSHCSSITAKQGQTVARGEYIAAIGITGRATAYHLHFEVQENNTAVDARPYLGIN
jgi:murein DD-endopeptidase MepM/ murein hydrolase activator NlpD